jgi:hypothetical protein
MGVFENRFIRRIFGSKRDELTVEWRKFHSEELHNLYTPTNNFRQIKSRRMRWVGHVARMGEECVQGFDGKARRKRPLGRPRPRWEDGITMDLGEIGLGVCGLD